MIMQAYLCSMIILVADVSEKDFLSGLRDAEAAVSNASFSCNVTCEEIPRDSNTPRLSNIECSYLVDSSGRFRYEAKEIRESSGQSSRKTEEYHIQAYNKTQHIWLRGNERTLHTSVIETTPSIYNWRIAPQEFLYTFRDESIVSLLKDRGIAKFTTQLDEGNVFAVVQTKPTAFLNGQLSSRFTINLSKGYSVTRKSLVRQASPDGEPFEFLVLECSNFTEVAPGIWVPEVASQTTYKPTLTDGSAVLRNRYMYKLHDWKLNQILSDSMFNIELPDKVFVNDNVKNTRYHTTTITDENIKEDVFKISSLKITGGEKAASQKSWGFTLLILNFLIAAAFVGYMSWRRRGVAVKGDAFND